VDIKPAERPAVDAAPKGRLDVVCNDDLAPIEVLDGAGNRAVGFPKREVFPGGWGKALLFSNLKSGFYRVRVLTPEGQSAETPVHVAPGEEKMVDLTAPKGHESRLAHDLIQTVGDDLSGLLGAAVPTQVSTLLGLCVLGFGKGRRRPLPGDALRAIGLGGADPEKILWGSRGVLRVLVAVDRDGREEARKFASDVELRFWPIHEAAAAPVRPLLSTQVDGLAGLARTVIPGSHWLSFVAHGREETAFSITVLRGHSTEIVFHFKPGGGLDIYQLIIKRDDPGAVDPTTLRRLDLVERFYLSGRLEPALQVALEGRGTPDPVLGCIESYLLLKTGNLDRLGGLTQMMIDHYPDLGDSHVARAEYAGAAGKPDDAKAGYHKAIELGLPFFGPWIDRLFAGVERFRIGHPRLPLLSRVFQSRIPSLPWSAWVPVHIETGEPITR